MFEKLNSPYFHLTALALYSRLFVLSLGKTASIFFERFDKSLTPADPRSFSHLFFRFLNSWDSFHFYQIAKHGYTTEHTLPFFPLYPWICRLLSQLTTLDFLTVGVLLNNAFFVISVLLLYKISLLFFSPRFSYLSAVYFICNPATVIYSSMYTESLFTLLFFLGFWYSLHQRQWYASALFSLSCLCRSNGLFFVIFTKTAHIPFCLILMCFYQLFSLDYIWKRNCIIKLFVPYSYIQTKYWNQGFLNFYAVNNIPNMIIGLPVILQVFHFIYRYKSFIQILKTKNSSKVKSNTNQYRLFTDPFYSTSNDYTVLIHKLFALLCLQILLTVFCIHWNMVMRFIAYNPIIYWISSYLTIVNIKERKLVAVVTFFMVYGITYIILFSCFYPPA